MAIKGAQARAVCREVIRQLGDAIPRGVKVEVHGSGKHCVVTCEAGPKPPRTIHPGDPEHEQFRRRLKTDAPAEDEDIHVMSDGSISGTWSAGGFGAWIPFLPRNLAFKLAMIDVVGTIQEAVTNAHGAPWPGEGFRVRAEHQGDSVRLWFEDLTGVKVPAAVLSSDVAGE